MLIRLCFVNGQQSTVNGNGLPLRRINVCLILLESLIRLYWVCSWLTAHCSLLAAKKSVVRCLLSVDFYYLCLSKIFTR